MQNMLGLPDYDRERVRTVVHMSNGRVIISPSDWLFYELLYPAGRESIRVEKFEDPKKDIAMFINRQYVVDFKLEWVSQ